MILNLPPSGALVRLIERPAGSYATAGETYRVTYAARRSGGRKVIDRRTSVRLWSEARDCGTYDQAWAWDRARWTVAEA